MPDPVTPRLYVLLDASPGRLPSSGDVLSVREASPAEVLSHPAVLALVADLADLRYDYGLHVKALDDIRAMCEAAGVPGETMEPDPDDYEDPSPVRTWHSTPRVVERLVAERARLKAVLDAERGERGPEGWRWEDFGRAGEWRYPTPTGAGSLIVRRSMSVRRWVLERWHDGEFVSAHDYALEAMEAADRSAADEGREG